MPLWLIDCDCFGIDLSLGLLICLLEFVFWVSRSTSKIFGFRAGYSSVLFACTTCRIPNPKHESYIAVVKKEIPIIQYRLRRDHVYTHALHL